jgi:ferredoxin
MIREIIRIDEEKCTGCGLCIPNCHEGALQLIDGKARLVSDLFCDGLGACIGHCPEGAITMEKREAEAYDEIRVIKEMVSKGKNTIQAHLDHLADHNEIGYLNQAIEYLEEHHPELLTDGKTNENSPRDPHQEGKSGCGGGCPGSASHDFRNTQKSSTSTVLGDIPSELRQWPVQMHLINPAASYFKNADVVIAADCVAFTMGGFHQRYLKGKALAIACPKLDQGKEIYIEKLTALIDQSMVNTVTVVIMEVPCCGGLLQIVRLAMNGAKRKVPLKLAIISIQGEVIKEEWI